MVDRHAAFRARGTRIPGPHAAGQRRSVEPPRRCAQAGRMSHRLPLCACLVVILGAANVARAEEPRTVDLQGGLAYSQPLQDGFTPVPAIALELRAYSLRGLWLAGTASWEPSVDLRNPEHGEVASLFGLGGGAGAWLDLGPALTLYGGARAEWAHAGEADGLRLGPTAALALVVGHAWGHPMALEAKLAWLGYLMDDGTRASGWQGGLYVSGTLFPDRPR
jgi:hypothetical protein